VSGHVTGCALCAAPPLPKPCSLAVLSMPSTPAGRRGPARSSPNGRWIDPSAGVASSLRARTATTRGHMGIFRRKAPSHLIPVHRHNAAEKDWVVLLEAGTIIGPSPERLRVAQATLDRKVVKKYNILLRAQHFLACGRIRSAHSCAVFLSAALAG
jgi:hypothetical protein